MRGDNIAALKRFLIREQTTTSLSWDLKAVSLPLLAPLQLLNWLLWHISIDRLSHSFETQYLYKLWRSLYISLSCRAPSVWSLKPIMKTTLLVSRTKYFTPQQLKGLVPRIKDCSRSCGPIEFLARQVMQWLNLCWGNMKFYALTQRLSEHIFCMKAFLSRVQATDLAVVYNLDLGLKALCLRTNHKPVQKKLFLPRKLF